MIVQNNPLKLIEQCTITMKNTNNPSKNHMQLISTKKKPWKKQTLKQTSFTSHTKKLQQTMINNHR